ncbi:acyl-homoserine-lactone synthase [Pontibaca methylaminivorans]|uniref:Acyl-homoserine-lactone synthase n=1 Tax=Pontibaca methylaminivorans TaxID=515897 RepID=A0A1R3WXI7_9RHOB|nr:acyl-homoserine-lactone synthase [Pontibaca methylaminivorans]SIT82848.1 acyl homoserine lactone synthase [Pontibaca methylaminivorans]
MLHYLYGHDLHQHPELAAAMFRDRTDQFHTRLGWDVTIDEQGFERDQYDDLDPLYVIWENADGSHGGSMRFLPTTGPVMVNDVFGHLLGGGPVVSPLIWECTRFCLARNAPSSVAAALMLGGGEIMTNFGIRHFVGVFDARMVRIYRAIGSSPEVLGGEGEGRERISVGLWEFSPEARARVAARAGIPAELSRLWFDRSFGTPPPREMALTA